MKKNTEHQEKIKQALENNLYDDEQVMLADGFEEAFLGICSQFSKKFALYDRSKCIEILMRDMDYEEAEEYFAFNVEGAYVGENTPAFLWNEPSYE